MLESDWNINTLPRPLGLEGGGEEAVGVERLGGGGAGEGRLAVHELVHERGPHLQDRVREAELEDRARDRLVDGLVAEALFLPALRAARVLQEAPRLRLARREAAAELRAQDLQAPRVR